MNTEAIRKIAVRLGVPDVADNLDNRAKLLVGEQTRISITGGQNVGKTTLVNALAGTDMEVSSLPEARNIRVVFKGKGGAGSVETESEWLDKRNIEIWELSDADLSMDPKPIDYGLHFVNTDVCVMLLNAMSALTRIEMLQLDVLGQLGIPTMLVLSKADQLPEADYMEIEKYVAKKTAGYNNVKLMTPGRCVPVKDLAGDIRQAIDNLMDEASPRDTSRAALMRLFTTDALAALFEECNKKIAAVDDSKKKVEAMTGNKKSKLSDSATMWLKLQTSLNKRKNDTEEKIKDVFAKKKEDTIRQLVHYVDMCADVKLYWEKELPYRLEDVVKLNTQAAAQLVTADVMNTINWLNMEVKKHFNKNLNSIQPIACTIEPEKVVSTTDPGIADNKKMRIVARVGTAATVIAAGTMFATMGIGGIVMATGMVAGVGAEFFMNRKQSESKDKVRSLIPEMVEQANQKLIINVSDNLNKSYGELMKNMQSYQDIWLEEAEKNIEKEHKIALFNCSAEADKWNECMKEINVLSEEIQNN